MAGCDDLLGGAEIACSVAHQRGCIAIRLDTPTLAARAGQSARHDANVAEGVSKIVGSAIEPPGDVAAATNPGPECDADEISQSAPSPKVPLGHGQRVGVIFNCDGKPQASAELGRDGSARPAG